MITRIKIYLPRLSPASNLTLEFYATENWPLQTKNLRVSQTIRGHRALNATRIWNSPTNLLRSEEQAHRGRGGVGIVPLTWQPAVGGSARIGDEHDKFHKRAIWKRRSQMLGGNDHSISPKLLPKCDLPLPIGKQFFFVSFVIWNWNHSILFPFIHDRMSSSGKINWTMLIPFFFSESHTHSYERMHTLAYINSSQERSNWLLENIMQGWIQPIWPNR